MNNEIIFSSDKTLYRRDRIVHGCGVLIAIAPSVPHLFVHIEVEAVCISVDLRPRLDCELIIVYLYIPSNKKRESIVPLNCLLDFISKESPGSPLLINGDFNFPYVDWLHLSVKSGSNQSELHKSFLNFLNFYNLEQLVDKPTQWGIHPNQVGATKITAGL